MVDTAKRQVSTLPRTIWYMGVKARVLPGFLDRVIETEVPRGAAVVDLMSGTGVVAAHCAQRCRVYANDVQAYSRVIARSYIEHDPASKERFLASLDFRQDLESSYRSNLGRLEELYAPALETEAKLLERQGAGDRSRRWCDEYRGFLRLPGAVHASAPGRRKGKNLYAPVAGLLSEASMSSYREDPSRRPACLMTAYYANVYFGLRQSLVIDSLRAAIEDLPGSRRFREAKRAHYLSALLHTASVSTSSTSHFAQPRHLRKDGELHAMARRRRLDILRLFGDFSNSIQQYVRATSHRSGNMCFARDYHEFIEKKPVRTPGPSAAAPGIFRFPTPVDLIYLDPPYTQDNYSRFYHVLEVLTLYDYPALQRDATGAVLRGRYPVLRRRFQSDFCRSRKVEGEFRNVILAAAAAGAKLVISYAFPSGLLLKEYARRHTGGDPVGLFEDLCREGYRDVTTQRTGLMHSGQGDSNIRIEELLLLCRKPR